MVSTLNFNSYTPVTNSSNQASIGSKPYWKAQQSNKLQRTPIKDTVSVNSNEKDSKLTKKQKILIGASIAATALVGVLGVRKYQVSNIKNLQKTFQEVFMRDDITPEMAKAMKARYKEIEKIKDVKEYTKALFEEAKKNYGFEGSPIKLIFEDMPNEPRALGYCYSDNFAISITSTGLKHRNHLLNTMHHEFRHAKQNVLDKESTELLRAHRNKFVSIVDEYIDKNPDIDIQKNAHKIYFDVIKEFLKDKVDANRLDYISNSLAGSFTRTSASSDFQGYWKNFKEMDARDAGHKIEKFVRGHLF